MTGYLRTKWSGVGGSHGYDCYKCNTTTPTSTKTATKHIGITIYNKINTTHTKRVGVVGGEGVWVWWVGRGCGCGGSRKGS